MRLKPTVLSIDDDPIFRKTIEVVLGRFGLNIKGVTTVDEFLSMAHSLKPDLYLIDLQLADSDGLDLIRAIRNEDIPNAYIIVISGSKNPEAVATALELGANDYILKPLDRVLLATKLSQFIETDEIREHRAQAQTPASGSAPVRLSFSGVIDEIDELGVKFTTKTLISKGTVLKIESKFFETLGTKEKEFLLTVTSSWLIPETQSYGTYAEFDGVEPEFLQQLRHWLSQP